jgi:hypothetical protein
MVKKEYFSGVKNTKIADIHEMRRLFECISLSISVSWKIRQHQ